MTDDEILGRWFCAECYGRYIFNQFDHGVRSSLSTSLHSTTKITLEYNGKTFVALNRNTTKSTRYFRDYFDNHGFVVGAVQDAQYVSLFSSLPKVNECWGRIIDEYEGSYSISSSFLNTQIYYADLRDDTLVYYQEEGEYKGSDTNDEKMGFNLVYADFGGQGTGCKSIHIYDAVKLDVGITATGAYDEFTTPISYNPYHEPSGGTSTHKIAASDRSGYCGGVSYGCYTFGNYAVVDQSKPYDCSAGTYEELVSVERIENFRNSWDSTGTLTAIDLYDNELISGYIQQWRDNIYQGYADGTFEYPSFIGIDPMPHGSWATDYAGNHFFSMITRDMKTFNKLNGQDPNTIAKLEGAGVVYYPVAPA